MFIDLIKYLLFLIPVITCYFLLPLSARVWLLLAAGAVFYFHFSYGYFILLVTSTLVDFYLARIIDKKSGKPRRKILIIGLIHNTLLLIIFKYLFFFTKTFNNLFQELGLDILKIPYVRIILPVGISYYTFRKISYLVDVYRQQLTPEIHFSRFLVYVSFFPSLLAGPIDRARDFLPQLKKKSRFNTVQLNEGTILILWGVFKKFVIADNLAPLANRILYNPQQFEGIQLITGILAFTFQVYCDFSGYSDIAIGSARMMGIHLMDNFNRPYLATSIQDFWNRWHISLSTWLRDYLFLPISYSVSRHIKKGRLFSLTPDKWAYILAIMGTMLLCGLWHDAYGTFIIWGGIHGVYLVLSFITRKPRKKLRKLLAIKKNSPFHKFFSISITFSFISLSWVFFKTDSLDNALYIFSHLFTGVTNFFSQAFQFITHLKMKPLMAFLFNNELGILYIHLLTVTIAILFMLFIESRQKLQPNFISYITSKPIILRWTFYYFLIFVTLFFGDLGETRTFIYIQF